jgi:hypothetical protein
MFIHHGGQELHVIHVAALVYINLNHSEIFIYLSYAETKYK